MKQYSSLPGPIGVFDSGYGGLTILKKIREVLPMYDYIYLGDNARAPYGSRSFEVVYHFTLQAVRHLFDQGCYLVILACNTASAKALRTIQQKDLPVLDPGRRVLGVIRPTVEIIGDITHTKHVGVLATEGTISSGSYAMEISKLFGEIKTKGEACPMWVPLVENNEASSPGADYFVKQHIERIMKKDPQIDTLVLACTHYPLLIDKIKEYVPNGVHLLTQGERVANSLSDYMKRHPEIDAKITKKGRCAFQTTESSKKFADNARAFLSFPVKVEQVDIDF